jgi:hypothetical protein
MFISAYPRGGARDIGAAHDQKIKKWGVEINDLSEQGGVGWA